MQAAIAKSTHAHGKHVLNDLPPGAGESLIDAARNTARVSGLTHNFYKYPARFSPQLARAAIEAFTSPVDLVLDPFVGGGTTLVEAMALGRDAIGTDISALATFVATVKTTPYSDEVLERATHWGERAINCIDMHAASSSSNPYFESAGYCRHLDTSATWRLRKAIDQALASARELGDPLEPFARCVILRTAQWALDGKKQLPSVEKFRINLASNTLDMVNGARALGASVAAAASRRKPVIQCLTRDTIGLEVEPALRSARRPKLVICQVPAVHRCV